MTTYNLKYYYNSQPTISTTETDLDVDYPYSMLFTLLTALTPNQRKNLKLVLITSGVSDKHKNGFKREINLVPSFPFYKVKLIADKTTVTKGTTVMLTTEVTNISTISKVEFYLGSTKLTEVTTTPYSYNYVTDKVGNYLLTAKVIDSDTVTTISNAVTLTVN